MSRSTTLLIAAGIYLPLAAYTQSTPLGLVVSDVTVISPERAAPLEHAYVRIIDGRIVDISAEPLRGEEEISGASRFLAPGLIDSHVHLGDVHGMRLADENDNPQIAAAARAQLPRSYLLYGYTTVIDTISTRERIAQWNALGVRPDAHFCGATPVLGGYGMPRNITPEQAFADHPYLLIQAGDEPKVPEGVDARRHTPDAVVARMKADGAICLKAFAEDGFGATNNIPTIPLEVARSLIGVARAAGLPVLMHANAVEHQQFALDAGADIIAHGMWHWGEYSPESAQAGRARMPGDVSARVRPILDRIAATRVGVQPTLQVLYGELDLLNPAYLDEPALRRVLPPGLIDWYRTPEGGWFRDVLTRGISSGAVKAQDPQALWTSAQAFYLIYTRNVASATSYLIKRNSKLLFGTDTPSAPTYANPPGLNGLYEMEKLVRAGMTPSDIMRAATIVNAEAFGLQDEIGTIEAGKRANLLLMRADPMQSVRAYAEIEAVIVGGRAFYTSELTAAE